MEINPHFGQQVSDLARSQADPVGSIGRQDSNVARNDQIPQRGPSLNVSIDSGNRSLELLYRSAINKLNEVLDEDMGANILRDALKSGPDLVSPAIANRILTLATAYLPAYLRQYPDTDDGAARARLTDLIGNGFEQGFAEAREILRGLDVLEGDIAADMDRTRELVRQGLEAFLNAPGQAKPG